MAKITKVKTDITTAQGMVELSQMLVDQIMAGKIDPCMANTVNSIMRTRLSVINTAIQCRKARLLFSNPDLELKQKAITTEQQPQQDTFPEVK